MRVPGKSSKISRSPYAAPKPTVDSFFATEERLRQTGTDFLKIDVSTALTFAQTALETDDPVKKKRNQASARKAYDTVLRLVEKVSLNDADASELRLGLSRLKSDLVRLGEVL